MGTIFHKYLITVAKNPLFDEWVGGVGRCSNEIYELEIEDAEIFYKLYYDRDCFFNAINEECNVYIDEYEEETIKKPDSIRIAIDVAETYIRRFEFDGDTKTADFLISVRNLFNEALSRGTSINFFF